MSEPLALTTTNLGKRYGSTWALQDCSIALKQGSVTALVGPNGAGKSTLLHLLVGLSRPTNGEISVFGISGGATHTNTLPLFGFVAQDHPLERSFTIAEMLTLGAKLNPGWDDAFARAWIERMGLPEKRKAGALSGGEQAQLALALALGKRPRLLVLDEPAASMDPLARRDFLALLMTAVAETGLTVLLSSHILGDLERVCDRLVLLARGRVELDDDLESIVASHRVLSVPAIDMPVVARHYDVIDDRVADRQSTVIVRARDRLFDTRWQAGPLNLEDIVLAYLARAGRTEHSAWSG
mgnify:CR=1 FL=1